nr:uncharacterized protein LOC108011184 isoform X2 [Drosophila suzukii]
MIVSQVAGRLITSVRFDKRRLIWMRSHFTYYPSSLGSGKKMNMFSAINNAMDLALSDDKSTLLFGEDVGFGGVFRCSVNLRDKYGSHRVFNSPLCEQGIAGRRSDSFADQSSGLLAALAIDVSRVLETLASRVFDIPTATSKVEQQGTQHRSRQCSPRQGLKSPSSSLDTSPCSGSSSWARWTCTRCKT